MKREKFYWGMILVGFLLPWMQFLQFVHMNGVNLPLFITELFVTAPAAGFTVDLVWSTIVFWVWSYFDAQENRIPFWGLCALLGGLIGLSVALPTYLLLREKYRRRTAALN